ncbi:aldehyde dehydrogenase family protein [Micromonospora sp. NPDC023966]|uniref:aldehyde dehydrogenase family protein n=1 Tax=Micromonospora sp. NPDC023966 TaxID=3154699 RepID=UPI0033DA09DC
MHDLPILGPSGDHRSRTPVPVSDVRGKPVAQLSLAPVPQVARAVAQLRRGPLSSVDERIAALRAAGSAFRTDEVGGLTANDYLRLVSGISGLGISTVRAATDKIARYCADADMHTAFARPAGVATDIQDPRAKAGTAVWVRRGDVLAVHAAGNHPAVHADWVQALALGYRVAVRPSRREPVTSHRLVAALRQAGFGHDRVVYLPSDYVAADEMLRGADRAMVYGGDDVIAKYAKDPTVLPQGPGRSKILIASDVDWRDYVDLVADSVSRGGGTGCTNTTAVMVEGDAAGLAEALAERLGSLPSLPPEDDSAILPVQPVDAARRLERFVWDTAAGAATILGADGIIDEFGDGSAAVRPAVFLAADPAASAPVELPFPCVWVFPWSRTDGVAPLRQTLALTVLSHDEGLIERLLAEPTVRNVYAGAYPTYWNAPHVPHDGYIADFLMEPKGFLRR